MNFAHSQYLLLLWLVPFALLAGILGLRRRRARLLRFAAQRGPELVQGQWATWRSTVKTVAFGFSLALLALTLAQPRWGYEWRDVPQGGSDIMVVLDLSTSMLANDINPTRLERAKRELIDLLAMLGGDRVGIVTFAGVAFVHCPLTTDYRLARLFIDQISTELMPVQGTELGTAIKLAVEHLDKASSADAESKAIVLITDGEDQGGEAVAAAGKAKEKGIKIFAIGIGAEGGAPIPLADGGFKKDDSGNVIVSKLDEATLQAITFNTGGTYVRSTTGDLDLENIYRQGIRSSSKAEGGASARQKVWYERFQFFLFLAVILLVLESLTADVRRTKTMIGRNAKREGTPARANLILVVLLMLAGINSEHSWAKNLGAAEKAFHDKDYRKAADGFLEAEVEEPKNNQHPYNRSVSQYFDGNFDAAAEGFAKAAASEDKDLASRSLYNLGNTLVAKGNLEQALQAYQASLKMKPDDTDTRENMQWVQQQIEKQKQNQQNQDKNDTDKKDEQKQDQGKDEKTESEKKQDQGHPQDQKDAQDGTKQQDNADKAQEQQEQGEGKNSREQEGKPADAVDEKPGNEQNIAKGIQQMDKETAERLLRSLNDAEGRYGMPLKATKPKHPPKKDW